MNSCAPISWLVWPSRASSAIVSSCGVSTSRVSGVRLARPLRTADPTGSERRGAMAVSCRLELRER
jgi:hypothetical protein